MKRLLMLTLVALGLVVGLRSVGAAEGEWKKLIGEKLDENWTTAGNWTLKDGVITLTPRPGESGWSRHDAYLQLAGEYKDFEISFDYNVQKGSNSGFYFHVGDVKEPVKTGIEVQIYDSGSKKEGDKLTDHDSGGVIPGAPPTKNAAKPAGEWNHFDITVKGDKLTVKLNGETVNELNLNEGRLNDFPKTGSISFQDHALPLSLREIKIRKL